jgi:hypothetical protein
MTTVLAALLPLIAPWIAPFPAHDGLHEAIQDVSAALARGEDAELLLRRAELLLRHGEPEDARIDLERAASLDASLARLPALRSRIESAVLESLAARARVRNTGGNGRSLPSGVTTLLSPGSNWKFLDDGSDQDTAWSNPLFDDSQWSSGPAELGYGDGDEATLVDFGGDPLNKFITTYFRSEFQVPDPSLFVGAELRLLRDDGAVVYLNGVELVRSNMPAGAIDFLTPAQDAVSGAAEQYFYSHYFDPALLQVGSNWLAIEIHQNSATSSDISLDCELRAATQPMLVRGPYLQMGTNSGMVVRWRTYPATDTRLAHGADPQQLDTLIDDAQSALDHEVSMTGLTADTRYFYSVGTTSGLVLAGGDQDHAFRTAPTPGSSRPTRIWVVGDSGTADGNAAAVRDAYDLYALDDPTDLWLMLGDNAYDSGTEEEYQAAVFEMYPEMLGRASLWSTRGNHEMSASVYYDLFTLPTAGEAGG